MSPLTIRDDDTMIHLTPLSLPTFPMALQIALVFRYVVRSNLAGIVPSFSMGRAVCDDVSVVMLAVCLR